MQKLLNDRRLLLPVLLTAVVIAVGAVVIVLSTGGSSSGGSSSSSADSGQSATAVEDAKVEIADFKFDPPTITVKAGGTVTWTNSDTAPHTATLDDDFDTGDLEKGDSKSETFDKPGTYDYVCDIHPFMHGTVVVK